ncbi:D-alanyl-D-alanine carboxypeptidase family protein [Hominifimenecus sp. rT4P-3]|uniref:D-alanyl-D-alanine carboxypeptidase family protein n=1 Tax=Hominifimenecus sp. rT4P-3 TaxID=3242979 RepID=UPI003DA4CAE5
MKRQIWRVCSVLLAILLVFGPAPELFAAGGRTDRVTVDYRSISGWPAGPEINSEAACLIDLQTGAVLYEKNADEVLYPASITKVLTALLIVENCDLNGMVTFSHNSVTDLDSDGISGLMAEGDQLSVKDCLYVLMLKSSNETAYALAEYMSGSVEAFAEEMNRKAKELGATHSNFANPHGLFHENHYTTAEDMARIFWGAIQNDLFLEIDSTPRYTAAATTPWPNGFTVDMRHQMLVPGSEYYDADVVAGKTGYIQKAQNTLVTYGVRGERELVCVTLKAESRAQSFEDTKKLLDYGFDQFSVYDAAAQADMAALQAEASKSLNNVESLTLDENGFLLLPKEADYSNVDVALTMGEPETNDSCSGQLVYSYQGQKIGEIPITAKMKSAPKPSDGNLPETTLAAPSTFETSKESTDNAGFFSGWSAWQITAACLLCALALVVLFLVIFQWAIHRRRKKLREQRRRNRQRYQ